MVLPYMLTFGVYWWDPCYHIWQHHGSVMGYIVVKGVEGLASPWTRTGVPTQFLTDATTFSSRHRGWLQVTIPKMITFHLYSGQNIWLLMVISCYIKKKMFTFSWTEKNLKFRWLPNSSICLLIHSSPMFAACIIHQKVAVDPQKCRFFLWGNQEHLVGGLEYDFFFP